MVASSGCGLKKQAKPKRGGKSKSSSPHSGSHPKVQPSPTPDPKEGSESSGDDKPPPLLPRRDMDGKCELEVAWVGYGDSTWEPIDNIHASEVALYAKANGLENHELFREYMPHLDIPDDEDLRSEQPYLHRSDTNQVHS